jgi:hypothetical protein
MDETFVTISINNFLLSKKFIILQSIPPGHQGSIYLKINNKMVYPDIIAFNQHTFLVGENKKTFDDSDIKKLLELKKQKNIIDVLNNEAMLYSQAHELDFSRIENIRFFHGISDIPSKNLIINLEIEIWLVNKDNKINILKN